MLKNLTLACLLLMSTAALANPSSQGLPPGEGGAGERDLRSMMDQRVMRLPAGNAAPLGLVPLGDEG